jgi:hypothetical protein
MHGGVSSFGTVEAALGIYFVTAAATTAVTGGVGLLVAGVATGSYLLIRSGWEYDDANEKAID